MDNDDRDSIADMLKHAHAADLLKAKREVLEEIEAEINERPGDECGEGYNNAIMGVLVLIRAKKESMK